MRVIDLCCGAGGASTGLTAAGFAPTLAVDSWDKALQTHEANHPDAEHVLGDVRDLVGSIGRADVVVASPPCQQFSTVGVVRAKGADTSIIEACRAIIEEARPTWFWLENVQGAANVYRDLGIPFHVVQANHHGLFHERRRIFGGNIVPPRPRTGNPLLFQTPLACDGRRGDNKHYGRGRNLKDFLRRRPELRDVLWAMGFPLDYQVVGNKDQSFTQVGNAVCPPVAEAIANAQKGRRQAVLNEPLPPVEVTSDGVEVATDADVPPKHVAEGKARVVSRPNVGEGRPGA